MTSAHERAEYDFLLANGRLGLAQQGHYFAHLSQPIGVWNYIRLANTITKHINHGHLLDWGCGYGQMTYLLRRRGLTVTPYDVGEPHRTMPDIPLCRDLAIVRNPHPTDLPFVDASFDAVLSCGVLEHVDEHSERGNELISLAQIRRVLRPNGLLLIYQLPQVHAWQEAMIRRFKLGYSHPRRYTAPEITAMLENTGYTVRSIKRANMIPRNLSGMPVRVRTIYNRFSRPLLSVDRVLSRIVGLNHVAGVMEIVAQRR